MISFLSFIYFQIFRSHCFIFGNVNLEKCFILLLEFIVLKYESFSSFLLLHGKTSLWMGHKLWVGETNWTCIIKKIFDYQKEMLPESLIFKSYITSYMRCISVTSGFQMPESVKCLNSDAELIQTTVNLISFIHQMIYFHQQWIFSPAKQHQKVQSELIKTCRSFLLKLNHFSCVKQFAQPSWVSVLQCQVILGLDNLFWPWTGSVTGAIQKLTNICIKLIFAG